MLVGYKQKTQFDIDRWLIGFEMTGIKVPIYELPVLGPWFPKFFRKKIDGGMRKGFPRESGKMLSRYMMMLRWLKNFSVQKIQITQE